MALADIGVLLLLLACPALCGGSLLIGKIYSWLRPESDSRVKHNTMACPICGLPEKASSWEKKEHERILEAEKRGEK